MPAMKALREIITLVILAVLIVVPIRVFIAQPFVVDGLSMYPTFDNGDYLIIDELSYRFNDPSRGDVVVFKYPGDPRVFYIKRIIGLPGETVRVNRGSVTVTKTNGETLTLTEPYVVTEDATYSVTSTLGDDQYFVMGDNRPKSSDSRIWGPLPRENLIGRAYVRIFPVAEAAMLPGEVTLPQ
jgi:signal peptidase I